MEPGDQAPSGLAGNVVAELFVLGVDAVGLVLVVGGAPDVDPDAHFTAEGCGDENALCLLGSGATVGCHDDLPVLSPESASGMGGAGWLCLCLLSLVVVGL